MEFGDEGRLTYCITKFVTSIPGALLRECNSFANIITSTRLTIFSEYMQAADPIYPYSLISQKLPPPVP